MEYRDATWLDAPAIAALHADSWRRSYRGSYTDAYLDNEADADRLQVWTQRLAQPNPAAQTVVAKVGPIVVGFVHTVVDVDPVYGALLDNLHVRHDYQHAGLGSQLMAHSAAMVLHTRPAQGLYLWVLEANVPAQRFYARRRGTPVDRATFTDPDGSTNSWLRYAWSEPSILLNY
jgi:ribosomal protein S18 acetylase RimI-like enzyme